MLVDVFTIRMHKKEAEIPYAQEWHFDEGVSSADEVRATDWSIKYGKKNPIIFSPTITIPKDVREIVEQISLT